MSQKRGIKYQRISLLVSAAGAEVSTQNVDTDKSYKRVRGIQMTSTDATAIDGGTFKKFEIDNKEVYPEGFETKLITCGVDVAPNDRFDRDIDERAEGTKVNITYKDGSVAGTVYPYNVSIYLYLTNNEK